MKIEQFDLSKDILIIAEIGNNHEGSYLLAEEMIGLAAEAGAGAVKFQTIIPEKLVSPDQKERIRQLDRYRLSYDEFEKLFKVARDEGLIFLSTPFDVESACFLDHLVPAYKIASGDNTFLPLIKVIAGTGKPVILSAGGTGIEEIAHTRDFIRQIWKENGIQQEMALLHCVISYPTPREQANLLAIEELKKLVKVVGYSDHTLGIEAAVLSVALGARIIEKHFTINRDHSDFRDHKISSDPEEFSRMVEQIKEAKLVLGTGKKRVMESERANIEAVRRSIVAGCDLKRGSQLEMKDISWVRPGGGLEPGREKDIIGKVLTKSLKRGEKILLEYLSEQ